MTADAKAPAGRSRMPGFSRTALVVAASLGPLLVTSLLYARRSVTHAGEIVLRGEADAWIRSYFTWSREMRGPPSPERLQAFLAEHRSLGLRYIGRFHPANRVEAGAPARPIDPSEAPPTEPIWIGSVVRFGSAFPGRSPGLPPGRGDAGPTPDLRGELRGEPRFMPQRSVTFIEFEPQAWPALARESRRLLVLGSATAIAVVVLSLWLWSSLTRRALLERQAERDRHLATLGEMSAVLAHEIRNPLASLKGNAQLLVETLPEGERHRAKADRVVQEAIRLERLTSDLLAFVRHGELTRAPADLREVVRTAVDGEVPAERLRLSLGEAPVTASVDADRLREVIENLARNAVQAGEGPVEVELRATKAEAMLTVRDRGPGIPAGQEERIFEPFVTTRIRGTGLGLAIARRIAEGHGGALTAGNHPEGGALFRLRVPR